MASLEGENAKVIDKFNGEYFNLWKSKLKMGLISMDLWDIVAISKATLPSNDNLKVKKNY